MVTFLDRNKHHCPGLLAFLGQPLPSIERQHNDRSESARHDDGGELELVPPVGDKWVEPNVFDVMTKRY